MDASWRLLLFHVLALAAFAADFSPSQRCLLRCQADCIRKKLADASSSVVGACESLCEPYAALELCSEDDDGCWDKCKDLGPSALLATPLDVVARKQKNGEVSTTWRSVPAAVLYLVQYKYSNNSGFSEMRQLAMTATAFAGFPFARAMPCEGAQLRVAAVSPQGISEFSAASQMPPPAPVITNATLVIDALEYSLTPYVADFSRENASIDLVFRYSPPIWPLGTDDLVIEPLFHLVHCKRASLDLIIEEPVFKKGPGLNEIFARLPASFMTNQCKYIYVLQSAESLTCGTKTTNDAFEIAESLEINCTTVAKSPCTETVPPPLCGLTTSRGQVTPDWKNNKMPKPNTPFNVTYEPALTRNLSFGEYWVAYFGEGAPTNLEIDTDIPELAGVNLVSLTQQVNNCLSFEYSRELNRTICVDLADAVTLQNLTVDKEYGVVICIVADTRNTTVANLLNATRQTRPRAEEIYFKSPETSSKLGMIIGTVFGVLGLLMALMIVLCCWYAKKQRAKNKLYAFKLAQMEKDKTEQRYTDLPRKSDIWEIERRNLIIETEKKLGSGAFGSVFMGKLLGKSLGHKDAQSPLGINMLRAENCDVAVKMLPEYADEMSKSEFLREIALMKSMGYHERLVNMLACITDSEPYCLVVEYCNDGDLLQFLRDRCKYMIKLDELGVNYRETCNTDDVDEDMILTMKQLLMFAVQISFGLEYLSQKGFVHRDVAARNVLVSHKCEVKIGDFGLTRYIYSDSSQYISKGGRLPVKWMSPEAIRHYEFSTKSDVWSFGVLLFEIVTLGGTPYPCIQPEDILDYLEAGNRIDRPDNCPDDYYEVMKACWTLNPAERPEFSAVRQKLAGQLEQVTEEYSYLQLDARKDYYAFSYVDKLRETLLIPEDQAIITDAPDVVNTSDIDDRRSTNETSQTSLSFEKTDSFSLESLRLDVDNQINEQKEQQQKQKHEYVNHFAEISEM